MELVEANGMAEPTTNREIDLRLEPTKDWEVDVRGLVSTKKWLQNYGLKKNRLSMYHLLPQIGFKHADGKDQGCNIFDTYWGYKEK